MTTPVPYPETAIAIIGLAARYPDAADAQEYWRQLCRGFHPLTQFADDEIEQRLSDTCKQSPTLVKAGYVLPGIADFDADFFGLSARESAVADPQQRLFLELGWEALEQAGYATGQVREPVGVFASANFNTYGLRFGDILDVPDMGRYMEVVMGNDKDYMASRLAYLLDLRGPALNVQSTCSSSLVSTVLACQSLQNYLCDLAIVGASAVRARQRSAYLAQDGATATDACCRAFDASASGMAEGFGGAAVVLKRFQDALADRDSIQAVILGQAINNDGRRKVGFPAPSMEAQREVIEEALTMAGVDPEAITYIEAHGTGTPLGDPIEVEALTQGYGQGRRGTREVALGSSKTNLGHLNTAAGLTGLIKTALCLRHKELVPSLHFEHANPHIPFQEGPFFVNTEWRDWAPGRSGTRYAAVNSIGIGGNNAHVVLAEAPEPPKRDAPLPSQLLPLSARTPAALREQAVRLHQHLTAHPDLRLDDLAFTLQAGRMAFQWRLSLVCQDREDAIAGLGALIQRDHEQWGATRACDTRLIWLFPGVGTQEHGMGARLYRQEPIYRATLDECDQILRQLAPSAPGLLEVLFGTDGAEEAAVRLRHPLHAMTGTFVTSVATARLLQGWGLVPDGLAGHSLGQYVAAHLAGVLSLTDALDLVVARANLLQATEPGAMLAVRAPEEMVSTLLPAKLSLGAVNTDKLCLVSGLATDIQDFEAILKRNRVPHTRLPASRAGHSHLLEPVLPRFRETLERIVLHPLQIPMLCNLSGEWLSPEQAIQPDYWVRHLRHTVRFAAMIDTLAQEPDSVLLEVGAGSALLNMVKQHSTSFTSARRITSLGVKPAAAGRPELLAALGRCWQQGAAPQWRPECAGGTAGRVPLPTYPFQRSRHWIDEAQVHGNLQPSGETTAPAVRAVPESGRNNPLNWGYLPIWAPAPATAPVGELPACCWIFDDGQGVGRQLQQVLRQGGCQAWLIRAGDGFARSETDCTLRPEETDDVRRLVGELIECGQRPQAVFHLVNLTAGDGEAVSGSIMRRELAQGCFSLVSLLQAYSSLVGDPEFRLIQAAGQSVNLAGDESIRPARAAAQALALVAGRELPRMRCRFVDLDLHASTTVQAQRLLTEWSALGQTDEDGPLVVWRGRLRWRRAFQPLPLGQPEVSPLKPGGTYLIVGGFGGIGSSLAGHLADACQARLILAGRQVPPEPANWGRYLASSAGDPRAAEKVRLCARLAQQGASVTTLALDLADEAAVTAAMADLRQRFGHIDGIIHAAGTPGGGLLQLVDAERIRDNLDAKLYGLACLYRHCADLSPDFLLLCSSLGTQTAAVGQFDNILGNLAMDAMAQSPETLFPVISVGWDYWLEVGMIRELDAQHHAITGEHITEGIQPGQGQALLEPLLAAGVPHALVSTVDMARRFTQGQRDIGRDLSAYEQMPGAAPEQRQSRPDLGLDYEAPTSELQRLLAEQWEQQLGVAPVGIRDNYLELGGDSLQAMPLVARLRELLSIDLPIRTLFEAGTIAALTDRLCHDPAEAQRLEELARLQRQVAAMSIEELESALQDDEVSLPGEEAS